MPDPIILPPADSAGLGGVQGAPKFDSKSAANGAYHAIMTRASNLQRLMGLHVLRSVQEADPLKRVQALDAVITTAEKQLTEFRRARGVLAAVVPNAPPPPTPASLQVGAQFERPDKVGSQKVLPRRF